MHHSSEKLTFIRAAMKERGADACIIPDTDPHISEYVPDHWRVLEWITGFTGSAGTLVITSDFAGLWTDARYAIQSAQQLEGSEILPVITSPGERSNIGLWLASNLDSGSTVCLDGRLFTVSRLNNLKKTASSIELNFDISCDLVSQIWTDRPGMPDGQVYDLPVIFSGRERSYKIRDVRAEMERLNVDYHLLVSPDDIMWLLNIRGKDVKYSPLLLSFAIVGMEQVLFFADENKIPYQLAGEFDRQNIVILPYEEVVTVIASLEPGTILLSPQSVSVALYSSIPANFRIREEASAIPSRLKAVKNSTEIENTGKAMIKDGVCLSRFFFIVENSTDRITEFSLSELLGRLRAEQEHFVSLSFSSVVAFNGHAALPHFSPSPENDFIVREPGLLLVDSGSHYLEGTTDITRTIALGQPSEKQKRDFTLVLKGMIALATAVFPLGTSGVQLDILARRYLWQKGIDYRHGTGHGVGFCLNVHEGPQRISPATGAETYNRFTPGMIVSDEPAVYREGEYGIRTENLLLCYENEETEFGKFLGFTTLSLCYIDTSLIDISMLDKEEISWLNTYHEEVYEKIAPHLTPEEKEWLRTKTVKIG
jgi:Xaa-Pro aminopeptidase